MLIIYQSEELSTLNVLDLMSLAHQTSQQVARLRLSLVTTLVLSSTQLLGLGQEVICPRDLQLEVPHQVLTALTDLDLNGDPLKTLQQHQVIVTILLRDVTQLSDGCHIIFASWLGGEGSIEDVT